MRYSVVCMSITQAMVIAVKDITRTSIVFSSRAYEPVQSTATAASATMPVAVTESIPVSRASA